MAYLIGEREYTASEAFLWLQLKAAFMDGMSISNTNHMKGEYSTSWDALSHDWNGADPEAILEELQKANCLEYADMGLAVFIKIKWYDLYSEPKLAKRFIEENEG
ncbi:MAG: hypothetical protein Kapaf2KO_23730 [Candidatus Kapaibacteriales bacterium]